LNRILKPIGLLLAFCWNSVGATELVGPFSPFSILSNDSECAVCFGVRMAQNEVPVFRAGERNSQSAEVAGRWAPSTQVSIRIRGERMWAQWPDGTSASGWGDVRLGTTGRLLQARGLMPAFWVDWVVKLPNAQDETGLGSDETDVILSAIALWQRGAWEAGILGGLAIWGDPLQFANQDDAALVALHLSHLSPRHKLSATLDWQAVSPRNPPRAQLLGGGQLRGLWSGLWVGAEAGFGLVPAAADWQVTLRFGVDAPCRPE
jgi:hypothetical protein